MQMIKILLKFSLCNAILSQRAETAWPSNAQPFLGVSSLDLGRSTLCERPFFCVYSAAVAR